MRRWVHFPVFLVPVLVGLWSISGFTFQESPQPSSYAVVIGVSQFAHLPTEDWLNFADADARDFYNFITSPRGRSFAPENVFLLTNEGATYQAIRSRLGSTLARKVKPGDTVYIFVATHGMVEKEASREAYLLANDSDREDLYSSALPMRELGDIIQNRLKNAGRIFLFADACRSGKLSQLQGSLNRYIEDVSKQRMETMGLLASRPNEFSREGKQFGDGHGVFTYYLLKGLMGEADGDKDQIVTAAELISYLQGHVEAATDRQQHVRDFGDFAPDTPLAFTDKAGPKGMTLTTSPPLRTLFATTQIELPESARTRAAFKQALQEGRLLSPTPDNAWDLYERYERLPVAESEKEAAKDDLLIALASAGEKVLWAYRRGDQVIQLDSAKYQDAALLFARASEIEPDDTALRYKAKFLSGRLLVENHRYAEALSALREAIAIDPDAAYSYNALGIAYLDQQSWNDAITNFKAASERAEKWVYPRYNLARVYTAQKRYREAEQEFKKAIEIGSDLGLKYGYLHYNLGVLYLFQGRTADAEQQFRRSIELKPDDAVSYHNLGLVFERKRDQARAQEYFEKAANLDAKLIEPRLKLADIYKGQHRDDQQGRMLEEAAGADPLNRAVQEQFAHFLIERKNYEQAEQVFTRMMATGPNTAFGFAGMGDIHAAQNRWKEAADDYRQAIARTTDPKVLRDFQKKLRDAEKKR
jgi:tetratricopeptide (TPR) repeat protein